MLFRSGYAVLIRYFKLDNPKDARVGNGVKRAYAHLELENHCSHVIPPRAMTLPGRKAEL